MSSSLLWALGNLALATVIFVLLYTVRFNGVGIWLLKVVLVGLLGTFLLSLRDILTKGTRVRGVGAILLCVPVLSFFAGLSVWEFPLHVSTNGSTSPQFHIDGTAGIYGIKIYSPEHSKAEWLGDDIGLMWSLAWQGGQKFPPMRVRFGYGTVTIGYAEAGPAPALNPNLAYTVVVDPAMGMSEFFRLRGGSLTKVDDEYSAKVCFGPLTVPGRHHPAFVRVDCATKQFLKMSERGRDRLKEFQERRLAEY